MRTSGLSAQDLFRHQSDNLVHPKSVLLEMSDRWAESVGESNFFRSSRLTPKKICADAAPPSNKDAHLAHGHAYEAGADCEAIQ